MDAISTHNLRRVYRSYEKSPGVLAAVGSLFKRTWVEHAAVDGISFSIPQGEIVGFVGPNGSGKTTTMKMLSGILTPTSGQCTVLGYTPSDRKRDFKRNIALVMGNKAQLIWDLPPEDTFALHRDLYQLDKQHWKAQKKMLTDMLDVGHVMKRPVRQLSLGERMKCELVTALLHEPNVLFLDEPTIGLDVISQRNLWDFLHAYQKANNTTMVITSHYMQDITNLCSRIMIIKKGKMIYDGDYDRLLAITRVEKKVLFRFKKRLGEKDKEKMKDIVKDGKIEELGPSLYRMRLANEKFGTITEELFKSFAVDFMEAEEADLNAVMQKSFSL